ERYTKEQGLFRVDGSAIPKFSELVELDLTKVEPSLAGPKRPQDRASLPHVWESFTSAFGNGPRPDPDALSKLSEEGGPVNGRAREAAVPPRRLWRHHVHRQLRTAGDARDRGASRQRGPERGRGPVGQSQLRIPDPPAGEGKLPRLAAARGRLRVGRHRQHRP